MSEYTPTTDEVRVAWAGWTNAFGRGLGIGKDEFDRWLEAEKAKWQAEAYERGLIQGRAASIDGVDLDLLANPYREQS